MPIHDHRHVTIPEASTAVQAAQDEVVKAERSLLLAAKCAQYALEDYAHRPAFAAVLDALAAYQAADAARQEASDTLTAALTKELR